MLVVVNPRAGEGRGLERWRRVEPLLPDRLGAAFEVVIERDPAEVDRAIGEHLTRGETDFIAAGGDGTVNLVARSLVARRDTTDLSRVRLGAIGLGSSNDFHKPFSSEKQIAGAPCRIDLAAATPHDVCLLTYVDDNGDRRQRPWLINASIGTTAEANHYFNHPDRPLRYLKRRAPGLGIAWAALRTVSRRRSQRLRLGIDVAPERTVCVANLGVVKNPHFTGSLKYDIPHEPDSGRFYIQLLSEVSLPRLLVALARLSRGRFAGQRGASSQRAVRLRVRGDLPFALEGDGEVVLAREASFCVLPRLLRICP